MSSTPDPLRPSPRDLARWQKAREQLLQGDFASALAIYQELTRRNPKVPELWFELGNAATGELEFAVAELAYCRVKELAAGNSPLLLALGQRYVGLRRLASAREAFQLAVAAAPDSVDARINLAVCLEKDRQLDAAWECVAACLAKHPRDDQARYFRAFLLHRQRRNAEAESALRDLLQDGPQYPYVKYAARHLLAVVLDELGQYAEAWRWLLESKAIVAQLTDTKRLLQGYDEGVRRRRALLDALTSEHLRRWRDEGPAEPCPWQPAFLGGHPRSGTTLVEQILGAHPEILAFDESEAVGQEVTNRFATLTRESAPSLKSLDALPRPARAEMRGRYFKSLLREAPPNHHARVLLDKNPSPTVALPTWLRVFPDLKVLIALRDPRDVVLSCFFQNITLNLTNANFLSLERTAKHYADLMDVWLRLRELGGFDWLETRYEDVVTNLEHEGRRVTEFMGLAWHPEQAKFYEAARQKFLFAPTYHDVTQPVYRKAVGRWQKYAEALAPIQPALLSYCKSFGYAEP